MFRCIWIDETVVFNWIRTAFHTLWTQSFEVIKPEIHNLGKLLVVFPPVAFRKKTCIARSQVRGQDLSFPYIYERSRKKPWSYFVYNRWPVSVCHNTIISYSWWPLSAFVKNNKPNGRDYLWPPQIQLHFVIIQVGLVFLQPYNFVFLHHLEWSIRLFEVS